MPGDVTDLHAAARARYQGQRRALSPRLREIQAFCALVTLRDTGSLTAAERAPRARYEQAAERLAAAAPRRGWHRWCSQRAQRHRDASREWEAARAEAMEGPLAAQLRTLPSGSAARSLCGVSEVRREAMVNDIAAARAAALRAAPPSDPPVERGAHVLGFLPAGSLFDGAAQWESLGFFDVENTPPFDLWLDYAGGCLYSYVPAPLVALADAGVEVNPEGCIFWVDGR